MRVETHAPGSAADAFAPKTSPNCFGILRQIVRDFEAGNEIARALDRFAEYRRAKAREAVS